MKASRAIDGNRNQIQNSRVSLNSPQHFLGGIYCTESKAKK